MKARRDLTKSGDYELQLTTQELNFLEEKCLILGKLIFCKGTTTEHHSLSLTQRTPEAMRVFRNRLKSGVIHFSQSAHVIVVHKDSHHHISYEEGWVDFEKLKANPMRYWTELRCDDISGRKLFIYNIE